jgi:hypothetical protein
MNKIVLNKVLIRRPFARQSSTYTLPDLSYDYGELEPVVSYLLESNSDDNL